MKRLVFFSDTALVSLLAAACSDAPESVPARADLLLTHATVIVGNGTVVEDASILVSNGRIQNVSAGPSDVDAAETIDLSETAHTVLPGLVDTHIHLIPSGPNTSDEALARYIEESLPDRLDSFLASGTTTVYDNGDFWPAIGEVRTRIASGELTGPRVFAVGLILTPPDGHPGGTICVDNPYCRENRMVYLDTPERAREAVDFLAEGGVDGIKVVHEHLGQTMAREVLDAVIEQAATHGLPVDSHNQTVESSIEAVEAGVARLVHPPRFGLVEGTRFLDAVVEQGVVVAATVGSVGPGNAGYDSEMAEEYEALKANVRALRDRNVLLSFGTDNAGGPAAVRVAMEVDAFLDIGLSPGEIIEAMTLDSAVYIGHEDELGTIETGKFADLLIVDGNPLDDPSALGNVVMVLKEGEIVVDNR